MVGSIVWQVVPVDGGQDGMRQLHQLDRLSHMQRFFRVKRHGSTGHSIAKLASPSAYISANHERSRALSPAFAKVGAPPAAANRVELMRVNDSLCLGISWSDADVYLQPRRFSDVFHLIIYYRFSRKKLATRVMR